MIAVEEVKIGYYFDLKDLEKVHDVESTLFLVLRT